MMAHDFKKFPELTNSQMADFYFESPHRQIIEDFTASVVKVIDGDTIKVKWSERDFPFPIRFIDIAAPEKKETGGERSQSWLENLLLGKDVEIILDPNNRVEKWGRLLGYVKFQGLSVGQQSILEGHSVPWSERDSGDIPDWEKELKKFAR